MTYSITVGWWFFPAIATFFAVAWALFWPIDADTFGIVRLFMMTFALLIAAIFWAVAGAFK